MLVIQLLRNDTAAAAARLAARGFDIYTVRLDALAKKRK